MLIIHRLRVKDHSYPEVCTTQSFHNKSANLMVRLFFLVLRLSSMCISRSPVILEKDGQCIKTFKQTGFVSDS